ncbi:MAG: transcriptional coactivator p15/PC4 family protein [Gemmobacter sp.]
MIALRKNAREEIRVSLDEFAGHELVNLRVWFQAPDGEMRPGKQGIAFRRELLADVLAAMQAEGGA